MAKKPATTMRRPKCRELAARIAVDDPFDDEQADVSIGTKESQKDGRIGLSPRNTNR